MYSHIDPATPDIGHSMEIMKLWSAINVRLYFDSGAPFGTRLVIYNCLVYFCCIIRIGAIGSI